MTLFQTFGLYHSSSGVPKSLRRKIKETDPSGTEREVDDIGSPFPVVDLALEKKAKDNKIIPNALKKKYLAISRLKIVFASKRLGLRFLHVTFLIGMGASH